MHGFDIVTSLSDGCDVVSSWSANREHICMSDLESLPMKGLTIFHPPGEDIFFKDYTPGYI